MIKSTLKTPYSLLSNSINDFKSQKKGNLRGRYQDNMPKMIQGLLLKKEEKNVKKY